jgi:hypothetical protein
MEVYMMPSRPALEPTPAVTGLLDLFAAHPLVALGEWHGSQDEADFVTALLHHPAFPATVRVIVVEFGNARHQAVVDRFLAGEPVAARDLRPVWRDFIGGFGFDAPIYEQFFRTVRAVNRTLPPAQRLRVLLGDPPADWSQITQETDIFPWLEQRDAHYAEVVEANVLAPGHRGLLIAGGMHFVRDWPLPFPMDGNVVNLLERDHPRSVHVILPHVGFGHETRALEPHLADWPIPSLVSLRTTWLGELDAALLLEEQKIVITPHPGDPPPPPPRQGITLGTAADSYLYLGPRSSLTQSSANPAVYRGDEQYLSELQRRHGAGSPFRVEDVTEGDPRLFPD